MKLVFCTNHSDVSHVQLGGLNHLMKHHPAIQQQETEKQINHTHRYVCQVDQSSPTSFSKHSYFFLLPPHPIYSHRLPSHPFFLILPLSPLPLPPTPKITHVLHTISCYLPLWRFLLGKDWGRMDVQGVVPPHCSVRRRGRILKTK